jgi:hypothetical protein
MKGTIHIFAYGEAQIISDTVNHKESVSSFKKLQAVIDDVKSLKPADVEASDYHAINIFGDLRVSYLSKDSDGVGASKAKKSYSVKFTDLNQTKLNALITEFGTLKAAADAAKATATV